MKSLFKFLAIVLTSLLLMVGTDCGVSAQNRSNTQRKTTTTAKKPAQKKATSTAKKPAQTTQKKPVQSSQKKPAQSTQKKSTQTQKKSTTSTQKKSTQSSTQKKSTSTKKGKKMSRQAYEKQQKDLQRQIRDTEQLINTNNKSVKSQSRDIRIRADEIRKRQALIDSKQLEIEAIIAEEDSLRREIRNLEKVHGATQKKYAAAMRHLYKWRSGYDELLFVISAHDLLEGARRMRYLRRYGEWRKGQARLLERQREATVEATTALAQTRSEHETVLKEIDAERAQLAQRQQVQEAQLADLQKKNKELQGELNRDRQRMAEVEKTIQRMIEEEIRQAEEARKREEEARRKAEAERKAREAREAKSKSASSGKSASSASSKAASSADKSSSASSDVPASRGTTRNSTTVRKDDAYKHLSGSFAANRGRLPYPVDANFAFLDHYNPSSGNSSIVLSTRVGAHACAIFDGVVQSCFKTSEEWTVIVQHGNYRSVYMNLRNVVVRAGQKVSTRQQLGTLKTEPESNRAEIRFWIYQNANAVNPERWLKR